MSTALDMLRQSGVRSVLVLTLLGASPLGAETQTTPPTTDTAQEASTACSSCDARKAGLKRLKAGRDVVLPPQPEQAGDS